MLFRDIINQSDLAKFLKFKSYEDLNYLTYVLRPESFYQEFEIKKNRGGFRKIAKPNQSISRIQLKIYESMKDLYNPPECVYSYVKRKGIKDSANAHLGNRFIFKVDLKDFFGSIHFGRVRGLFMHYPFNFSQNIAQRLATLVTYKGSLPQGGVTSPLISNLIMRNFDRKLLEICKRKKLTYTRYADDLVFSISESTFPKDIGYIEYVNGAPVSRVGTLLKDMITKEGMTINEDKVILTDTHSKRAIVNGIVVKRKLSLKKSYLQEIRNTLYIWKKHGKNDAVKSFNKSRNRNRHQEPVEKIKFEQIVWGKILYLGHIYGYEHRLFKKYFKQLSSLVTEINIKAPRVKKRNKTFNITIYVEGKTDVEYFRDALNYFQSKGRFTQINPSFVSLGGENNLFKRLQESSNEFSKKPEVYIFDSDVQGTVEKVTPTNGFLKDWGKNTFSLALVNPAFRDTRKALCIEYLFKDNVIKTLDGNGRRLFFPDEFDENGFHLSNENIIWRNPKSKKIIIDDDVMCVESKCNVALPKGAFLNIVKKHGNTDPSVYDGFERTYLEIETILK
ncbi:reverse transcriptase family protein [Halobacteriovorax sp. ZH4_bin.1]|uniref:reverse transcriptase family protein n=1 Tax=unclassified Halobacteriovorax TaxID=2639665 RepID=UPI00371EDD59